MSDTKRTPHAKRLDRFVFFGLGVSLVLCSLLWCRNVFWSNNVVVPTPRPTTQVAIDGFVTCGDCRGEGGEANIFVVPGDTIIKTYPDGARLVVFARDSFSGTTYFKVRMHDGVEGWILASLVRYED